MNKECKEIPGYHGRYTISITGQIIDLTNNTIVEYNAKNGNGHHMVSLYDYYGYKISHPVHHLMLYTFKPDEKPNNKSGQRGYFKDFNSNNLHIDNISWGHVNTWKKELRLKEEQEQLNRPIYHHYLGRLIVQYPNYQTALKGSIRAIGDGMCEELLKHSLENKESIHGHVFSYEDLTTKYDKAANKLKAMLLQYDLELIENTDEQ